MNNKIGYLVVIYNADYLVVYTEYFDVYEEALKFASTYDLYPNKSLEIIEHHTNTINNMQLFNNDDKVLLRTKAIETNTFKTYFDLLNEQHRLKK